MSANKLVLFSWMTGNSDMHCKNFSLIDTGNGEYVLSPAYDLLAVLLADPADTEEMAMSFSHGGEKSGFDRSNSDEDASLVSVYSYSFYCHSEPQVLAYAGYSN